MKSNGVLDVKMTTVILILHAYDSIDLSDPRSFTASEYAESAKKKKNCQTHVVRNSLSEGSFPSSLSVLEHSSDLNREHSEQSLEILLGKCMPC